MENQRPKHDGQIGFRLPTELRERLDRIHERHLTSDASVFRALAEAFCEAAEQQQRVALPLTLQFASVDLMGPDARWSVNERPSAAEPNPKKSFRVATPKKKGP